MVSNNILNSVFTRVARKGKKKLPAYGKCVNPKEYAYGRRVAQTSTGTDGASQKGMRPVFAGRESTGLMC